MTRCSAAACIALLAGTLACESRNAEVRSTEQADADEPLGVLVGLSSERTLWIASSGDTVRVVADVKPLLVPRDSGFWWIGSAERCTVDTYDGGVNIDSGTFISRQRAVYSTPVGHDAVVRLKGISCDDAAKRPGVDGDCVTDTRRVTYVSASVLSVEDRYAVGEQCSPAKYYTSGANRVMRLADSTPVPLAPLVSKEAWAASIKRLADNEGCGASEDAFVEHADSSWVVRRERGAWVASVWLDGPIICRGGSELDGIPLSSAFTGATAQPISWNALEQQIPHVRDAVFSPQGGYVVALVGDTLAVARVNDGRIAATPLRVVVAHDDAFVMLRWASAKEVVAWSRAIPTIPAAVVRISTPKEP